MIFFFLANSASTQPGQTTSTVGSSGLDPQAGQEIRGIPISERGNFNPNMNNTSASNMTHISPDIARLVISFLNPAERAAFSLRSRASFAREGRGIVATLRDSVLSSRDLLIYMAGEHRLESPFVLRAAIAADNLDIVLWLVSLDADLSLEECTRTAVKWEARRVLAFMARNLYLSFPSAREEAEDRRNLRMLEFIHELSGTGLPWVAPVLPPLPADDLFSGQTRRERRWKKKAWKRSGRRMMTACTEGNFWLIRWLHGEGVEIDHLSIIMMVKRGKLSVLKWANATIPDWYHRSLFVHAAFSGHLHVLDWFLESGLPFTIPVTDVFESFGDSISLPICAQKWMWEREIPLASEIARF